MIVRLTLAKVNTIGLRVSGFGLRVAWCGVNYQAFGIRCSAHGFGRWKRGTGLSIADYRFQISDW